MTRLTAAIRDSIIENAVANKKFPERDKAIVQKRAEFAEKLRLFILGEYGLSDARLSEIHQQLKALRNEVTHNGASYIRFSVDARNYRIEVNMAGQRRIIYRNGCAYNDRADWLFRDSAVEYDESTYTPHDCENDFIVHDPQWREELDDIDREAIALRDEYMNLQANMLATLKNFTTVEKLLEAWPDVKELIPETLPLAKKPGTGVALSVADLNALCGIPTGK